MGPTQASRFDAAEDQVAIQVANWMDTYVFNVGGEVVTSAVMPSGTTGVLTVFIWYRLPKTGGTV